MHALDQGDERTRPAAWPWAVLSAAVFAAAAYLCLVNLDYAALWHDEAPTALIAKNLLERGDIVGWDGRNLVGGTNGRCACAAGARTGSSISGRCP